MGDHWILIFTDLLLRGVVLFLCEHRQRPTVGFAVSVTLSITLKPRVFSCHIRRVADITRGLSFPHHFRILVVH